MPTNANTFNSRITSESLEKKFRDVFPAQGGAELIQDLYAAGTIQPVIDFSTVAEGSVLPTNLQTAWDFSTGSNASNSGTPTIINNTGFWLVDLTCVGNFIRSAAVQSVDLEIFDGSTSKPIWGITTINFGSTEGGSAIEQRFVVFLRAGDSLLARHSAVNVFQLDVWYRQIADVNGNLVNPLGFTFS